MVQAATVHGGVHVHTAVDGSRRPPMLLPAPPAQIRDRERERGLLEEAAARYLTPDRGEGRGGAGARPDLLVISGPGGAGATALAADLAHRAVHAGSAPDGALWADLSALSQVETDPAATGAALAGWLRTLGAARIPAHLGEAAAMLRSLTTDGVVAVIDRATSAAQVRALLPATGLVIVTSRHRLPELAADGAHNVELGSLPFDAGMDVAADVIGSRATADPAGLRALVAACGGLPAAIVAAASYVAARPHRPIGELAARLSRPRLRPCPPRAMAGRDDPPLSGTPEHTVTVAEEENIVNAAVDAAYSELSPQLQHAYQVLAVLPGPIFSTDAAAAVLQLCDEATDSVLAHLRQAHLVQHEIGDQWRLRDPTQAARLVGQMAADEHDAVVATAARHYLMWAASIDTAMSQRRRYAAVFTWHPERPSAVTGRQAAIAAMQPWVATLLASQAAAADAGQHYLAWQFTDVLWGYVIHRQDYATGQQVCQVALDSARRCGDVGAQARIHMLAGALARRQGHLDAALDHHAVSDELARQAGDTLSCAATREHLGATLRELGRPDEAIAVLETGLALYDASPPYPRGRALLLRQLGAALSDRGRHHEAAPHFAEAEQIFVDLGEEYPRARLALNQAEAAINRGDFDQALERLDLAADLLPDSSAPHDGYLHCLYAKAHTGTGNTDAARRALATAEHLGKALPADHPTAHFIRSIRDDLAPTAPEVNSDANPV
ncbi:tetratricopeptide repeat protein [Actinomadura litoris]|uniref:tetratricopeptide repeat protein n=1 Tax=Actinomadura litoris TaxID=2678616 RepID=UPI001FA71DE7|nr:tetratricopeptide repeat protein [Actinomadura litoris]